MNTNTATALILASTSPYRKRLLERLGIPFHCVSPETDETPRDDESSEALAGRLADAKALAVSRSHPHAFVLGSDQAAALGTTLLGKPGSIPAAHAQLALCSAKSVGFQTAVTLAHNGKVVARRCVPTVVRFRALTDRQIEEYVDRERPLDCAGSFRWEGLGICLFTALDSADPTALEGLPLIATCDLLSGQGLLPLKK